uniref:NADH-ubiquinone oxidoreductase chain 6 n=1 Tax=Physemacris variolosa TaxID=62778 RepID=E0YCJ7_9ORTH|nr:NADH dehydrogenase subunit 6 [Physemacris variolosa]ADD97032.1 NADH dehydrogenase subunit 6 [Physemacris variolosa]
MINILILSLSMTINIMFMQLSNPMSMMMLIIIQSLIICLMSGMIMESYWMSYIMFLVMLGGMLILFIYISSIASNEPFSTNSWNFILFTLIMTSSTLIIKMLEKSINKFLINSDNSIYNQNLFNIEMSKSLLKLYNSPTFPITILMMIYLLLAMMVVIKIININQGPIRKMN